MMMPSFNRHISTSAIFPTWDDDPPMMTMFSVGFSEFTILMLDTIWRFSAIILSSRRLGACVDASLYSS